MTEDLIDRIYECAAAPDLWPEVLDELAQRTESRGGLLFSARKTLCWTASGSIRDVFEAYITDGWFQRCPRRPCLMSQSQPSFFVEQDFWSADQIDGDPIYRDFFRPRGLGWSAGTGLQVPTGDSIVFSMERAFERGPFERQDVEALNDLRPHLARSALVSARLGLERARGMGDALAALRLPALLLAEDGVVIEANAEVQSVPSLVRFAAGGRIALADKRGQALLTRALAGVSGGSDEAAGSFPLRDEADQPTAVAHLIPVRRSAHDIFGPSLALLLLTPVRLDRAPPLELMRSLFDLTPAEARIAQGVAAGQTLEDLALQGSVSINTVRNQLRRVLEKTGCSRQAELAALLAQAALGPA
ncbi:helix-turn-helix transcriptional regulator [Phenylobacterium sp.]|uniref:helix-turn-helix transcriptional regulator n=1 Tax=Phenylobacterium sp. TaxID=1871053 RepID=UPI002FDA9544